VAGCCENGNETLSSIFSVRCILHGVESNSIMTTKLFVSKGKR
jgi:hypothetical protein